MKRTADEVDLLVRAGFPCLALLSSEEDRCAELIADVARRLNRKVYTWSMTDGWTIDGVKTELRSEGLALKPEDGKPVRSSYPIDAMQELLDFGRKRPLFLVFKDLPEFFEEAKVVRKLADVLEAGQPWTVFFATPHVTLPSLLEKVITLVEVPLPGADELREVLLTNLRQLARDHKGRFEVPQRLIEAVVRAALGLTRRQADWVFKMAIENDQEFTEADLDLISAQKRQIIAKSGVLEYCDHDEDMTQVGGLDGLKTWLLQRQDAFTDKARDYGLPQPKGVFLLGVQGCGKSLISKAIASYWHMPLLRLDVGALFSSYIGRTEENLRNALRVAESIAPCVLWIDEIEKGFAGAGGSGNTDAGTTARTFGGFITWMQEKTAPVFLVATANSIEELPPELLRKGRFDEIFFVDLPTVQERADIFQIQLQRRGREPGLFDLAGLAQAADGYSGAEIEQAIVAAMYTAFPQGREFTSDDVRQALSETMPLSQTMADRIQHLRQWATRRARWATTQGDVGPPRSPSGRIQLAPPQPPLRGT